jgi:DNA sulfur modification protein DndB
LFDRRIAKMTQRDSLKLGAIRIKQGDTTLYSTVLRAGDVAGGMTKVDAWTSTNKAGYQRMPVEKRFRDIAKYVTGKEGGRVVLPQAVVLNYRDADSKLRFRSIENGEIGTLEIGADQMLWEVDGQHRLGGLRRALEENPTLADYPIPVVIVEGLSRLDEAFLFFVINTTQKRVPTDLAQRLIEQQMGDRDLRFKIVTSGKDWIPKGVKVVDAMISTPGHPWHNKIGIPGPKLPGALTKQVSFVTSLKPILTTSPYLSVEPADMAQILIRYWQALQEIFPEAFSDPGEYVIQKTSGIFSLHSIAPEVFDMVRTKHGRITKEGLAEVLKDLNRSLSKEFGDESIFWHNEDGEAAKYLGQKGFRMLTEILREHLPAMKRAQFV